MAKLDHPNIVNFHETYIDDKFIYLVMEFIGGGQLFQKIKSKPNAVVPEHEAVHYVQKILFALCHMHSQGVIHRDLKPENIMLTV